MKSLNGLACALLFVIILGFPNSKIAAQQLGQDCQGNVSTYPEETPLSCNYWVIKIYDTDGSQRTWGAITGKTREGVTSQLERDRALTRKVFPHAGQNYESTSEPICDLCGSNDQKNGKTTSVVNEAKAFISKYQDLIDGLKLGRKLDGLYKSYTTKTTANPYGGVGSIVTTYKDNVADALEMQRKLEKTLNNLVGLSGANLLVAERYFETEFNRDYVSRVRQANASFDSLPGWLQRELSGDGEIQSGSLTRETRDSSGQVKSNLPCCGYYGAVWWDLSVDPHPYKVSNAFRSVPCVGGNDSYSPLKYAESIIGPSENGVRFFLVCKPSRNEAEQALKAPPSYRLISTWSIPDDPHVSPSP